MKNHKNILYVVIVALMFMLSCLPVFALAEDGEAAPVAVTVSESTGSESSDSQGTGDSHTTQPEASAEQPTAVKPSTSENTNAGSTTSSTQDDAQTATETTTEKKTENKVVTLPTINEEIPTYTVKLVNQDDAIMMSYEVNEDQEIGEPLFFPMLEGYEFMHWYNILNDETEAFDFTTKATEDITLKTYFEEIEIPEETTGNGDVDEHKDSTSTDTTVTDEQTAETTDDLAKIAEAAGITLRIVDETEDDETFDLEDEDLLDGDLLMIEDDIVPLAAPPAMPAIAPSLDEVSVQLQSNHESVVKPGDKISVWADVSGTEGLNVNMQWQYSTDGGASWCDASGATGLEHSFEATFASVNYDWRLNIELVDAPITMVA